MKFYEMPEVEISKFTSEDIMDASNGGIVDEGGGNENQFPIA